MDRRYDMAMALVVIALGVFVFVVANAISSGFHKDAVGPRAFFYGVGTVFIVGGGSLAIRLLLLWKGQKGHMIPPEGETDEEGYPVSILMAAGVIAISILYVIFLRPLGYLITTPLYITGGMAIFGERRWGWIVLFALGFTLIFYIAFAQILKLSIPVGPLTTLFRDLGWIIF
jgi:putative tricarboxylic transport membrane protein